MNKYLKKYCKLISKARNRQKPSCGTEEHHCKPKCMKGGDDKRNLVYLTYKEHYSVHKWLTKIFPNNNKIRYAWIKICFRYVKGKKCFVSAEDYKLAKIKNSLENPTKTPEVAAKISKARKKYFEDPENRKKQSEIATGRKMSEEAKNNMSESQKKGYEEHPERAEKLSKRLIGNDYAKGNILSEEARKKMSKSRKGRKMSEENKQKLRLRNLGNTYNLGKHLSEETKNKIGEGNKNKIISKETRNKISNTNSGKKRTEEQKKKISDAMLGHKVSKETKQKMSDAAKRRCARQKEEKLKNK